MYQTIRYEKNGNIGIATINRPEALNALNSTVISELEQVISVVEKDAELGAFIITGEGHIDRQTLGGKLPYGVLQKGMARGIPVIAVAGRVSDAEKLLAGGFEAVLPVTDMSDDIFDFAEAMVPANAAANISRTVARYLGAK